MNEPEKQNSSLSHGWFSVLAIGAYFAIFKLLLHFIFNSNYGYFRDELYFMACGEHLAWGYPDHAPMIALMTKASRVLFGDSLFAIRFFPAVAGAVKVFLTALLVKEFGGKRFAVILACLCVLCAPVYLAIDNLLAMNALEPVFWMACVYFAVLAVKRNDPHYWLGFGLSAGLGLMNKHSMLFFGLAMVIGLLLTKERKIFLNIYLWIAGIIAFLIFLPNIVWQFQNNFATLELLQNVQTSGKNVVLAPPAFILQQIMTLLPTTFPVWLAGIWYLIGDKEGKRFRFLGICYLVFLGLMIYFKAKDYYLVPIYPMLFAAGAVWWELLSEKIPALWFIKLILPILIIGLALIALPTVLPVLPVEALINYQEKFGLKPAKSEVGHEGVLQQVYGDQFGWPEMVEKVADVYNNLPPEEREKAGIYASNYGEAGAIDFFGQKYGLPKAISGHQSYFLWGPRNYTGEVLIVLGSKKEELEKLCGSVEEKTEVNHPYSMAEEKYTILVCRNTQKPLPEIWPKVKHWN